MNALERKVLELIGESPDTPDVFTDDDEGMAPIRQSISDAIAEIVMLTGGYKRQYFIPLREGHGFYRIALANGDLGWITDVWSVTRNTRLMQTDITRLAMLDPRWMTSNGSPRQYLPLSDDVIGVYPKPSGSDEVLELALVEIPSAYTGERDRIKLRDSFQYATVCYAVSEFWSSRGDAQEALKHMQYYLDALGLKQTYSQIVEPKQFITQKAPAA